MESSKKMKPDELKPENPVAEIAGSSPLNKESTDAPEDLPQCSNSVNSILNLNKDQAEQKKETGDSCKDQINKEDEKRLVYLSNFSEAALAAYIKELSTEIYELGLRETRELSRSKHLRVFSNTRRRANKRE